MHVNIMFMNIFYAVLGAVITLAFMSLGYVLFDRVTPFNTGHQLEENNIAVGIVVGSIFVGLGIAVGLVIGMGLN
jgi:uncharacterized membrane protein YjfL (UPF0719 family)